AGTPGVSDPGGRLVQTVREAGLAVVPIPGASAVATALSVSGFVEPSFHFVGFLPTKNEARAKAIDALAPLSSTLVLYEAPHRVHDTMHALANGLGPHRRCVIARELTKLHEQIHALTLGEAHAWFAHDANRSRGEFVLLVEGAPAHDLVDTAKLDRLLIPLVRELPLKQAVALTMEITGAPRNAIYARALEIKGQDASR
ncbi:MAG TPA: SAM-dependent methyltransferase, partial [Burkholderiaceae bacterium]|nr:SAM-dependent methyltransferase [Burkholderiaceae bacterium]